MQKLSFVIISIILLITIKNVSSQNQEFETINLNNSWEFKSLKGEKWFNASVPGSVHTDLFNNKLIPDPYKSNVEKKLAWIDTTTWIYKKTFQKPKSLKPNQHIYLVFEGLDTYADIIINDSIVHSSNNMFLPVKIEIDRNILKKKNELKIIFHPTTVIEKAIYHKLSYKLPEGSRSVSRKAAYQYGWDWAPKYLGCGIWKNVELQITQSAYIKNLNYSVDKITSSKAEIIFKAEIESFNTIKGEININSDEHNIYYQNIIQLKQGRHNYTFKIEIDNPQLWWTHNLGLPYLYDFVFNLNSSGKTLHSQNLKLGIRKIELVQENDSLGNSFYFKLNNIPVFMKGANYVPQSSFSGSVSNEQYKKLIQDAKSANMNMLRVWGGGIYEKDIFYDLCDKKGILVWQDFMFANTMFPHDSIFLENIKQEAQYQTQRLSKHPCIALWCGNNEIDEAWHNWGWSRNYTKKDSTILWNNYLNIFHEILPNIVNQYSQDISYSTSSPLFGRGNSRSKTEGDNHYWYVWHDEYDFNWYNKVTGRFMSEFGFQSYPNNKTIDYFYSSEHKNIDSEIIAAHQKHHKGNYLINHYMKDYYPIPEDFEEFIYVSQLLQAEGIRTGILAQRRAKPFCMGSIYWQLNDCWPAISWSSIDYLGNWKTLHYFARQDFKNIILSPILEKNTLKVFALSDSISIYDASLRISLIDFYGNKKFKKEIMVSINKNNSTLLYEYDFSEFLKKYKTKKHAVVLELENNGKVLDKRIVYFAKPKDLDLKKININYRIKQVKDGYQITLKSTNLLKNVYIEIPAKGFWNNNFFDLIPGEEAIVIFKTQEKINHIESKIKFTSLNHILNK